MIQDALDSSATRIMRILSEIRRRQQTLCAQPQSLALVPMSGHISSTEGQPHLSLCQATCGKDVRGAVAFSGWHPPQGSSSCCPQRRHLTLLSFSSLSHFPSHLTCFLVPSLISHLLKGLPHMGFWGSPVFSPGSPCARLTF